MEIRLPPRFNLLAILSGTAALNLLPLLGLFFYCLSRPGGAFSALGREGFEQLGNTLLLLLLVAIGVGCLGTAIGWLTACCRFPARGLLTVAQLIPLAIPAYLEAAVITDLGSRHGLRLHGISWAAAVLILSTMPYVVLLSRDSFRQSGRRHLEASRSLGLAAWGSFKRVALPMALPAIASGIALAGMEVVNEFGAVELLGVPTLSTGLLQRWQGEGDPQGATSLALTALAVVALLVAAERWQRRLSRRWDQAGPSDRFEGWQLHGPRAWLASSLCLLPPLLSGGIPLIWICSSWDQLRQENLAELIGLSGRSLALGLGAAVLALFMALILAVGSRWLKLPWLQASVFMAGLGYAVPGAVLALALLLLFAPLGVPPLLLLLWGYGNRFLAVAKGGLDASLERLPPSIEEAAASLGKNWQSVLTMVHLPVLRSPLLLAGLLVFVDTVKELPLTFALRPFNFDTLAVRVYQYASDERLGAALAPALLIVGLGLSSALMLMPQLREETTGPLPPVAN
ncbi:MAG: ABC-type Fe3+ transport system permease component [Cyanobacteriota bacterium]